MKSQAIILKYRIISQKMQNLEKELEELRDAILLAMNETLSEDEEILLTTVIRVIRDNELSRPGRKEDVVFSKHFLRFYLRTNTKLNLSRIAILTGCGNHSTVINSIKVHQELMETGNVKYLEIAQKLNDQIEEYYEEEQTKKKSLDETKKKSLDA